MLLQFSVSNYGSIKNEVLFSLVPSADKSHPENLIVLGKYKANAITAIYGANASGKSTLFKAMTNAIFFIRTSNLYQVGQGIPVVPYKFCDNPEDNPTKFEFSFIAGDGRKYVYGFSATVKAVLEEYLYCYKSAKASMVFERKGDSYVFSRGDKAALSPLTRMNTSNKLFLSTATVWNAAQTITPFKWFADKIDTQTSLDTLAGQALEEYRIHKEDNVAFVIKLMKQADINITDVSVETKEVKPQAVGGISFDGLVINNQIIKPQTNYQVEIVTGHSITDESGMTRKYDLSLNEESMGSIQLFYFAPFLRRTLETGKVLMIDEIDRSLHPFIVKFLINVFRNKEMNRNGAQLIFTTHETTILSLDTFRRDEVYFTEKNSDTGITDLYALDDFAVRKDENIEKGYLIGRYGAIPFLQTEEIV